MIYFFRKLFIEGFKRGIVWLVAGVVIYAATQTKDYAVKKFQGRKKKWMMFRKR